MDLQGLKDFITSEIIKENSDERPGFGMRGATVHALESLA